MNEQSTEVSMKINVLYVWYFAVVIAALVMCAGIMLQSTQIALISLVLFLVSIILPIGTSLYRDY
jgi:hypothetical protein